MSLHAKYETLKRPQQERTTPLSPFRNTRYVLLRGQGIGFRLLSKTHVD
jgi:hypothetical protein